LLATRKILDISHNHLSGEIPLPRAGCSKLEVVDLSWINLEGCFTDVIFKWMDLHVLKLDHNYFQGPLPDWILGFQTFYVLDLSSNNFSGLILQDIYV
jgi:hypothetical protein